MRDLQRVVSISLMAAGYATLAVLVLLGQDGHVNKPALVAALAAVGLGVLLRVPEPLPEMRPPPMPPPPPPPPRLTVFAGGDGPPSHVPTESHVTMLRGRRVVDYAPDGESDFAASVTRIGDPDGEACFVGVPYTGAMEEAPGAFDRRLSALLADPRVGELRGLLTGVWSEEGLSEPPDWSALMAAGPRLGALEDLFLGDIPGEECEISWICLGDVGPVISALPALRHVWIRTNGPDLLLTNVRHPGLRHLTIQTGGMMQTVIDDLFSADLPQLRELVLWLGVDEYGNNIDLPTLPAMLARFPNLVHLGLQDAENQDDVVEAILPVLPSGLRSLDLSMGTLSDRGARALLACDAVRRLQHLNLRHHYIRDPELLAALAALPCVVDLSEGMGPEDFVYVEVSE